MIGILANVAMQYTHWSTRICLVPMSHVRDRTIGALPNSWVNTQNYCARLSDLPNRNPIQYSENIMVDRLMRLGMSPTPELMDIDSRTPSLTPAATPSPGQQGPQSRGEQTPRRAQTPSPTGSRPWRSPVSSPDSPPPGGSTQPVTPARTPTATGPGSGLLTSALRPIAPLPPALTPSKVPLPQSTGVTPYGTPQRRKSSGGGSDTPMKDA